MTREIRKDLKRAARLYKSAKRQEAFEIYDEHFSKNPEAFDRWDRIRYCWCMYYLFIKDQTDETDLVDYTERVCEITAQEDLNKSPVCVYTQCVFKVIMFLKVREDWEYMLYWLDKLNPRLLSEKQRDSKYPSKKEDYYKYLSTAYLKCGDWQECIDASKEALNTIESYAFHGDIWHMWRIAKSLNQLSRPQEALDYLNRVVEVEREWYVLKEMADCHHQLGNDQMALEYAKKAVLSDDDVKIKVNLYLLIYRILKDSNESLAITHARLYLAIKLENGGDIADEIEDLNLDEDGLDIEELESEIRSYWSGE
ncbi:MAG: tetratricopeptide repeat protein [Methanobrevibacter sp.]|nr:tetratricopeptide repeat protein [Methanobrevibacter sp.]